MTSAEEERNAYESLEDLAKGWDLLLRDFGLEERRLPWRVLGTPYRNGNRLFHNEHHVLDCLRRSSDLGPKDLNDWARVKVEAALFLHDWVYDPRSLQNEEDSAVVAHVVFDGDPWITHAIRATTHTGKPANVVEAYVMDIDLGTLAADTLIGDTGQIRMEYSHVPEDVFWPRRADLVRGWLEKAEKNELFHTDWGQRKYLAPAVRNLEEHLELIQNRTETGSFPPPKDR